MASEINDLNIIQDEDTLRRMWQDTEDFGRKKEIRLRMYRLREERLKSYYITRETTTDGAVISHKPASSSHAESLSDQGFLTMKTKEIRDSASPTLDLRQSNISSLSTNSQSEQLANQNIVTTSRQTVEKRSFNSSGSSSNQLKKDQTGSTIVTYGTSTIPYNGNNSEMTSYDSQDLHNNHERSMKSVQSSATEKYYTSSKREVESSSAVTENRQQRVISNDYNTSVTQNANNHNIIRDNTDYQVDYLNQKTNEQNVGRLANNNTSHHSQESIEYHSSNISDSGVPHTGSKVSTSKHSNQESNYIKSSRAPSLIKEKISIENTASDNNYETKCVTNKTVSESQQNFDRNIMKELQKLDSYLSTEAVTHSSTPSSPASNYTNKVKEVDRNINSTISKQIEPTFSPSIQEPTDHTTTYQQAYSKISIDTSATHNAFASSLRASPDRSITSPGKRTPSRSSLDRSTPDKSPRTSPEKSSCNDLSRKYTASFQNRVSRNSAHMRDSKSSSPTKYVEPRRKQRSRSSSSETDSDNSTATYNTKVIDSTASRNTSLDKRNMNTEYTDSFKSINEKGIQQNLYMSPTKSSGHTSEGSVEREIGKLAIKSPDSSPERSAFKPVISNNYNKSATIDEQVQIRNKKQNSSPKISSLDTYPVATSSRQQSISPNSKKQSSPPITSPNHQHTPTDLSSQGKTRKQSSTKLNTTACNSSIKTVQRSTTEIQKEPSQTLISSPVDKSQPSSKRQSSPQIISSNICSAENITNRNQMEIKRQSSPQIYISAENIYKPEPRRHPSLQPVISTNNTDNNETLIQEELEVKGTPHVENGHVKKSKQISQQEIINTVDTQNTNIVDHKQSQLKKQVGTPNHTYNKPVMKDQLLNSKEQPSSQTIYITNTCISETTQDTENIDGPKQTSPPQIIGLVDNLGPMKPKRQSQRQIVSTTVTSVSSENNDETSRNIQKQTSGSDLSKSAEVLKKPKPIKVTTAIENITEIEQKICSTKSMPKKKSRNRQSSPEKTLKLNTNVVESIGVEVTSHDKSSLDTQQKNKNKKKIKTSPIKDGKIVDVDENDTVEEIKVRTTPTKDELRIKNSKVKMIPTNSEMNKSTKDEIIKVSIPKQRSASYNEFSTPRKKNSIPISVTTNESSDESSSTSESSSEDEREKVTIEEIFDEFGTPIPRETNPLEAALKLEAAIKSKEEVDREQQVTKDIRLIPEDIVNLHTKNQSEAFIKQEKLIQEGDEDDCLPPVEQVLGKDVEKAALNDFLEWERKQSLHKHTHSVDVKENTLRKPEMKQKVIEPVQTTIEKGNKYSNKQQKLKSINKVESAETNKSHADKKIVSKTTPNKKLLKEDIQTVSNLESLAKKPRESLSNPSSKLVTKQSSHKDIIQPKKSANITSTVTKQLSDRSLKEKNEKLQTRKLDHQHKTKSETSIKPAKSSSIYQRRVTDQVPSNILHKSNTDNCFNKENRYVSKSSKTVAKESPRNIISKTVKDVTVTKNISKPAHKLVSPKTVPTKTISSTPHKISQTNLLSQTNRNYKEKVIVSRESVPKPAREKPKSVPKPGIEKVVKLNSKKPKEQTISESSTSTSSVENLHEELTTCNISQVHQQEPTEYVDERVQKRIKLEQELSTSIIEPKDHHLNVVIRMPSSSRETTPNKQTEDRFYPVSDDNEAVPRYADQVTSPDDIEVIVKKKSTNLSTFEKITDLDEEDEISDSDLANASVAERRTKFLESAKETTTTKQTTIVEDDIFQNRELGVSKTKEMFETIAKNQVPGNNTPVLKPPPIITRPSVFEAGATVVELGHDGVHHTVSKKLTEQDYKDYVNECEDTTRVDITKITKSFEDKAAENSKLVVNIKPKKSEIRNSSFTKERLSKETSKISSVPADSNIESVECNTLTTSTSIDSQEDNKCRGDFCTTLSHIESKNTEQSSNPSSSCTSPTVECKASSKQPSSPTVISKTQPLIKSHTRSPSTSPIKEIEVCNKPAKNVAKPSSSPTDYSNKQQPNPSKPVRVQDHSSSVYCKQPTSPEIKHTTNTTSRNDSKGDIIQSTTHRYEIRRKSPTNDAASQKPIEITQIEVRPSKHVYEHTAITNVRNISSKFTPVEETFNQRLTRYSDNNMNSSLTKPTESSKRKASKSPSPEKAPLELVFTPKKSRSPPKDVRESTSNVTNSPAVATLKRHKSPSPDKVTSKLRNKFISHVDTVETKPKKFEKRLSTTGSDYQKRKKFFETNTAHGSPKQSHPGIIATNKYEITVRATTKKEKPNLLSGNSLSKSEKSPTRRSPSKSPERKYEPKIETTRRVTEKTTTTNSKTERRIAPTKTITTTTTTTTTIEPKRFTLSPERVHGSNVRRTTPEKITKKEPFGITLRKIKTPSSTTSTTSVRQIQRVEADHLTEEMFANGKKIEEIFNLELLERMLEKAVQYDLRSRIRAQIRLVKRQQETTKSSRAPSPEKLSPTRKIKISSTSLHTPQSTSITSHTDVDSRLSGSSGLDRRDKVKKRLFTDEKTTSESKSSYTSSSILSNHDRRTSTGSPVRISETNDQSTYQTDFGSALTTNNDCKSTTDSIISGYGVGPTDENGRPLFGLKALRTSSESKIAEEDLNKSAKIKTNYEREVTDNSGRPLFGLKALQKSSKFAEDQFESSPNERQPSRKYDDHRTVKTESSSHVYSSRTAMRSDGSGNVSVYRDEVKGELFSKDGKEPTGKMIATRYAYHKPEGEEATVKTETTSSYLNAKSRSSEANQIGDGDRQDKWKSSSTSSKLGSSSLIRKISNEHFEKAQRKFSSGDETATTAAWNESDRKASVDSASKYETSSSSRLHKSFSKTDSSEKVYTHRYSTESSSSTKRESYDGQSSTDLGGDYGKVLSSTVSSHQTNDEQPRVSKNDSFRDVKSKFQQATVSSSMKNVSKSPDGRTSPTKLQALRRSPDIENAGTQSSFSSHKSKSNTQSSDGSYYYETRSYTESSSSNSQDLLNRAKDSSFRPRSEYTDEEKEAVSLLNELVRKPVSLREMQSIPRTTSSIESTTSKAATLVRKFEKQQNKTKQNKEEINVEQIWDEDQLRDLLEACTDYESRRQIRARLRAIMAENKADADVIATPTNADIAPKNGECLVATAQRSQSSPSSIIEDSGTESGEDLRLLNPELLAEVRGALSKLESALPTLDTARRASIIPLVTKLQSCLQVSQTPHSSAGSQSSLPCKRYASAKQQLRKNRHTIGVSKEELADARKWLAENFLDDSEPQPGPKQPSPTNCMPMKYESKQYKPVKFTPIPPRERQPEACEFPLTTGRVEPPIVHQAEERDVGIQPQFACRAYTEPDLTAPNLLYRGHYNDEPQLYKQNFSSDEGDVSSTEEEASKAEPNPLNGGVRVQYSPCYEAPKKVPVRFHQKNNKKMRMKRANTIDIPKLLTCENVTSSGDESICRSADEMNRRNAMLTAQASKVSAAPPLQIRTEKDKKFANFLRQTMQDEPHAKTVAYNPCAAGGAQWSNRFSNIKTTFESVNAQKSSSSPEDMSSKKFKPIRKAAPTLAKESGRVAPTVHFTHAPQSPFKPVPKAFHDCAKPRSRDSGYDSHTNSVYQPDHNSLPKHFFNSLDRKTAHSTNAPKTYYTPMSSHVVQPHHKRPSHAIGYSTNGYKTDSHLSPYYGNVPSYYENYANMRAKPYAAKQNYHYPVPKPEYFLNEPSAYLPIPDYATGANFMGSQEVSPTIPTTCSSSPTYEPYVSLPTSPLHNQLPKQPAATHWKPAEYYEEQPAIAKIMGKPQQAVVVNSKTNYRNETAPVVAPNSGPRIDKPCPSSTYQKLAQKSPLLQNFTQHVPRTAPKESKPVAPAPKPLANVGSPVAPRKQVKIIAAGFNDDEENLPEQFFVQNQRSKFESLSAGATAPQPLPPQINEKAFFKPVSAPAAQPNAAKKKRQSPPVIVQQCRSPPQSPVMMPSVLQKSESWHQMIMERMKQAKPPSPIKPKIPRAKSTHNLACAPKQYEAALTPEAIEQKKLTVEQFLGKSKQHPQLRQTEKIPAANSTTTKRVQHVTTKQENSTKSVTVTKLNEDFKHVDEAFELLFSEASAKKS